MTNLIEYRASIRRLIEAEDPQQAFDAEGIDTVTANLITKSKSFIASRSAIRAIGEKPVAADDRMSHRQGKRRTA